jgi:hypothetical protein
VCSRLTIANDLGKPSTLAVTTAFPSHGFERRKAEGLVPYWRKDDERAGSRGCLIVWSGASRTHVELPLDAL